MFAPRPLLTELHVEDNQAVYKDKRMLASLSQRNRNKARIAIDYNTRLTNQSECLTTEQYEQELANRMVFKRKEN